MSEDVLCLKMHIARSRVECFRLGVGDCDRLLPVLGLLTGGWVPLRPPRLAPLAIRMYLSCASPIRLWPMSERPPKTDGIMVERMSA